MKSKGLEIRMKNILSIRELTDEMMILYTEGKYSDALELVEQNANNFLEEATRITFWKLCLLSLCGRADDVLSVFQQGLDSGLVKVLGSQAALEEVETARPGWLKVTKLL